MKNAKKVIRILSWCIFVVYLVALVYFLFCSLWICAAGHFKKSA